MSESLSRKSDSPTVLSIKFGTGKKRVDEVDKAQSVHYKKVGEHIVGNDPELVTCDDPIERIRHRLTPDEYEALQKIREAKNTDVVPNGRAILTKAFQIHEKIDPGENNNILPADQYKKMSQWITKNISGKWWIEKRSLGGIKYVVAGFKEDFEAVAFKMRWE